MQKLLILISFTVLFNTNADAQFFKSVLSGGNNISNSVAVIAENFQNNFNNIQGEELQAEEGRDVFSSTVKIPGSSYSIIYRFHSKEDSTAAFESLLYEGESYKDALKVYKQTFRQINGMKFNSNAGKLSFDGKMETPSDILKFTSSNLYTDADIKPYRFFMAQIEMLQSIEGWKVKLNLHSRKDDNKQN